MKPFFSIVIPVYNVESYLARCMESVQNQTFADYEIILVDDGSKDSSGALCDQYKAQDERITVIHKENGGLSSARNAGIENASGRYICFVDSDDWIAKNYCEVIAGKIKETNADLLNFHYSRISKEGTTLAHSIFKPGFYKKQEIREQIMPWLIAPADFANPGRPVFSAWSHVYKMEIIEKNHMRFVSEREIGSEDYLFNMNYYLNADSFCLLEDSLYFYDQRGGSLTQRYRKNLYEQNKKLYSYYLKLFQEKDLYERYKENLTSLYLRTIFYVAINNECKISKSHTKEQGIQKIKEILQDTYLKKCLREYSWNNTGLKGKVFLFLMRFRCTRLIMQIRKKRME